MKKIKVTRKQVIDAIRFEPLVPGLWCSLKEFDHNQGWAKPALKKDCEVCAVGGVIRRSLRQPTVRQVNEVVDLNVDYGLEYTGGCTLQEAGELVKKNPWNALSAAFEKASEMDDYGSVSKKTRDKMIQWVKKYFPKTITLVTSK